MVEAIATVLITAVVGSLAVPLMMLSLARLGYFEPIEFDLFGRQWSFAPKPRPKILASDFSSYARLSTTMAAVCIHLHTGAPTSIASNVFDRSPTGTKATNVLTGIEL